MISKLARTTGLLMLVAVAAPDDERFDSGMIVGDLTGSELEESPVIIKLGPVSATTAAETGFVYQAEWNGGAVLLFDPATKRWNDLPSLPWPDAPELSYRAIQKMGSSRKLRTPECWRTPVSS